MSSLPSIESSPGVQVAIQGFRGSYSDMAAQYLYGSDYGMNGFDTFEELFEMVAAGEATGSALLRILSEARFRRHHAC